MHNTGIIFDIQRMSLHNGDGLRTSVFLKGCPLSCLWCHNPESRSGKLQVFHKREKCIACGECLKICDCHTLTENGHQINRDGCVRCMRCAEACPTGALERVGQEMTVEEVLGIILRDKTFYESSGGGVTITGGEPLYQPEFTIALARASKDNRLNVAIDTSGFAPTAVVEQLAPWADTFLFDVKETDPALHKQFTGVDLDLIHRNLRRLDELGVTTQLRCPIIPGCNQRQEHLEGIAQLANTLQHVREIDLIPYHPLGKKKCDWLDCEYPVQEQSFTEKERVAQWAATVSSFTKVPVYII